MNPGRCYCRAAPGLDKRFRVTYILRNPVAGIKNVGLDFCYFRVNPKCTNIYFQFSRLLSKDQFYFFAYFLLLISFSHLNMYSTNIFFVVFRSGAPL